MSPGRNDGGVKGCTGRGCAARRTGPRRSRGLVSGPVLVVVAAVSLGLAVRRIGGRGMGSSEESIAGRVMTG